MRRAVAVFATAGACIGQAQRTFVEVNEEGMEAAAVTDIGTTSRSAMADPSDDHDPFG